MERDKLEKIFNYSIGCLGLLGVLAAILALFISLKNPAPVIQILEQHAGFPSPTPVVIGRATTQPQPTYTPYPTPASYPVVATRAPVIVTPTPSAEEQNPSAGSIIPAGQAYTKGDITIRLLKKIGFYEGGLGFSFEIGNTGTEQYIIRWKNSAIHLRDDVEREYAQSGEEEGTYNEVKAFTLDPGKTRKLEAGGPYYYDGVNHFGYFEKTLSYDAKYLLITIDQIAGMSNLNWRYDLP